MNVPEKLVSHGDTMLNEMNFDMAAFYYESAAEKFIEIEDYSAAIKAYEKVVYCFEADERLDRANEIKAKIALIKAQHNL